MRRFTNLLIILILAGIFQTIESEALPGRDSEGQNTNHRPGTSRGDQSQRNPRGRKPPVEPHRRDPHETDNDIPVNPRQIKHEFDRLVLVQNWLKSACCLVNDNNEVVEQGCTKCNFTGTEEDWILHGLWPSYKDTSGPNYCHTQHKFKSKDLNKSLEDAMHQKWRSAYHGFETKEMFWHLQWKKHGSCAAQLPELSTVSDYISKALLLFDMYRVGKFLSKAKITPNVKNTYEFHEIYYAIRHGLGHKPIINCVTKHGLRLLYEVRICFSKTFRLIDCPDERTTNCFNPPKIQYH